MHLEASTDNKAPSLDQPVLFARLAEELRILGQSANTLQLALNELPLAATDSNTRKALQSVDRMTQSLACLEIAIDSISPQDQSEGLPQVTIALDRIFLEEIRNRLASGEDSAPRPYASGEVDLF